MPPRRGRVGAKSRRDLPEWSPRVLFGLTTGTPEAVPVHALHAAWKREGAHLLEEAEDVAEELEGFWRFAPGVPPELRQPPPALYPVDLAEQVLRERQALYDRRRGWLASKRTLRAV